MYIVQCGSSAGWPPSAAAPPSNPRSQPQTRRKMLVLLLVGSLLLLLVLLLLVPVAVVFKRGRDLPAGQVQRRRLAAVTAAADARQTRSAAAQAGVKPRRGRRHQTGHGPAAAAAQRKGMLSHNYHHDLPNFFLFFLTQSLNNVPNPISPEIGQAVCPLILKSGYS